MPEGTVLHRVVATKTFTSANGRIIHAGDVGGWIEKKSNLSGNAWVSDDAQVYGDAQISGEALVFGNATVSGNAKAFEDSLVVGNAQVYGDAQVYGNDNKLSDERSKVLSEGLNDLSSQNDIQL